MDCPECQSENREGAKFCNECGYKFEINCPECEAPNRIGSKFCDKCGYKLESNKETFDEKLETESLSHPPSTKKQSSDGAPIVGERKHVTALFSDLTGYTAMSEKLDPEEVKEITSRIFGEISKIVANYDGFIEKYAGDAVMAIFGVPQSHEDDPIRAIKAAREIHQLVDEISPEVEKKIEQPISMHTGINTGLVVTGEVDMQRGTHGIAGDTINLASRLSNLAKPGEILVDTDTCRQAEGHFTCEYLEETRVKGKADPIQVHKILSQKDKPVTIHRLSGLRADLVGRKVELAELSEAVKNLREGRGRIFSICGAAGTGKSRLVEEFKATLDFEQIQWIEGHAYAYSQNIPYFPLIDLLNRVLHIEENDPPEKVREKLESGIEYLVGEQEDIIPYVGGLYSLSYPEVEDVSPEFWKVRLQSAIKAILSGLANKAPTIYFLEDLHWADPSFVELFRQACFEIRKPAIVLCVYRPTFSLFTAHQLSGVGKYYHEIQLQDLSRAEAQDMLESLLKSSNIPYDLKQLVQSKAEGNPFYLEELVNSLIESETLIRHNGHWKITKSISEADISSSIHGLISGRLDRLEKETKRILQEASVIGRAFLYEILIKITELKDLIDGGLSTLERLDLVRTRSFQPDLEYMFKHPLTQEVVYNGILKKERQTIHERIAGVVELVFRERLPEFYETLSFHYTRSRSVDKAVEYLIKSGEKSLTRYSVEEAQKYYKEAFDILTDKRDKTEEEKELLVDLLCKWAWVFLFRGHWRGLFNLFSAHENHAKSLNNKVAQGMFYAWFGLSFWGVGVPKDAYANLQKALSLGEETGDLRLLCYSNVWLSWTCTELGKVEEGIAFAERGYEIAKSIGSDHYLNVKSVGSIGHLSFFTGDIKKAFEIGKITLEYGRIHSQSRSLVVGHNCMGYGHFWAGDFSSAIECFQRARDAAIDPFYFLWANLFVAGTKVLKGELHEADEPLQECVAFCDNLGCDIFTPIAHIFYGVVLVAKGKMSQGLKMIENASQSCLKNERKPIHALAEYVLGKLYFQMSEGAESINVSTLVKNIPFIIKNIPFARKKSEEHFIKAIDSAKEIGSKGIMGVAYLDLGSLHINKKRTEQARECISEAITIFKEIGSEGYLKQAEKALASLV